MLRHSKVSEGKVESVRERVHVNECTCVCVCACVLAVVSKRERKRERDGRVVVALGQFPATLSFARVSCIRNEPLVLVTAPLTTKC